MKASKSMFFSMALVVACAAGAADLVLIGDSTLAPRPGENYYPPSGSWGDALTNHFTTGIACRNYAVGGRTVLTTLPTWEKSLAGMNPGDFVIVQFGINDANKAKFVDEAKFKETLGKFIDDIRSRGAIPVLCGPVANGGYPKDVEADAKFAIEKSRETYRDYTRAVATEKQTDFVDMTALTAAENARIGRDGAHSLYRGMWDRPDKKTGEKRPTFDITHPNKAGAKRFAELFIADITARKLPIAALFASTAVNVPNPADMRGPFPIMSTPYHEDGSIDYEVLGKEAQWVDDNGCPGVIWCQSNDAIDLLTVEEKFKGFEACAKAVEGRKVTLALGANGTNAVQMLEIAAEIERVAARHPKAKIAMISRPPDDVRSESALEAAWDELGKVAKRPVIFQTHCSKETPTPSVEMMVRLAAKHPHCFGYIKEEAAGNEANDRMEKERDAKPTVKTVFAGWGGWQWLLQLRHCGSEGLVTERCAYAPILGELWRRYERGERGVELTSAFAMYRLLVDQRNMPAGLRGYSLYLLQKEGVFRNLVSRQYEKAKVTEGGSFGNGHAWKLEKVKLSDRQRAELDLLLKDMTDFVK